MYCGPTWVFILLVAMVGVTNPAWSTPDSPNLPPPPKVPGEVVTASGLNSGGSEKVKESSDRDPGIGEKNSSKLVDMNFSEMIGLDEVAEIVSRRLGKNMILDPNLKGKKIQIIAPKKVSEDEAWQIFLSVLDVLNLATVETGRVTKIIRRTQGIKDNLPVYRHDDSLPVSDLLITQVIPLKYVNAKSIQASLSRFTTPGSLVSVEETNHLIISDSSDKVRRVLDIISLMDVKSQQDQLKIFQVKYGQASKITDKIKQFMVASGGVRGKSPLTRSGSDHAKLISDDTRNIIGVFASEVQIKMVKGYLDKLDLKPLPSGGQSLIHILPLEYADAKKMSTTLSSLSSASSGAGKTSLSPSRPVLAATSKPGGAVPAVRAPSGFKVTADESSNSLLVVGDKLARDSVSYVVKKFDVRKDQVLIEAQIMELGADHKFKTGSSFFLGQGGADADSTKVITAWKAGDMSSLVLAGSDAFASQGAETKANLFAGNFNDGLAIGALAGQGVDVPGLGKISPGALIRLVKTDQNTKVLSSPYILALDNEEASLSVGETVFFNVNASGAGTAGPRVEKENVDLTLNVTPSLSWGDYISLNLSLEANQLAGLTETGLPSVNKRKVKQVLTLKNGQTAVIAGLKEVSEVESLSKIPLLGDLPILGGLFRTKTKSFRDQQLAIFLTVWAVRSSEDLKRIYKQKIKESQDFLVNMKGEETKESYFYSELPGDNAADYEKSDLDIWEEKLRAQWYQDGRKAMGYPEPVNQDGS